MSGTATSGTVSAKASRRGAAGATAGRDRRILLAAGLVGLGLAGAVAVRVAGLALDDIYVTYRYARNLAAGLGLVFNPGERVFGVTDPGVSLLLGAAHAVTGIVVPLLGTLLTALSLWVAAAVLAVAAVRDRVHDGTAATGLGEGPNAQDAGSGRSERNPSATARAPAAGVPSGRLPEALIGGLLLLTSGYLWIAQGSGPLPALAMLLVAAWLAEEGNGRARPALAGLAAGAAVWFRPDAAVGALFLGLLVLLAGGRLRWRAALVYAAGLAAAVLPGLAAARLYFGTFIPNTLGAKQQSGALRDVGWEGGWAGLAAFWEPAWGLFRFHTGPFALVLVLLALVGLFALWRRGGLPGRLLLLHGLGIAAAYSVLGVPFFLWYTVPPAAALLVAAAWGAGALVRAAFFTLPDAFALAAPSRKILRLGLGTLLAASSAVLLAVTLHASYRWWRAPGAGDWRLPAYRAAGLWLRDHTPPDAEVALEEIGIVGYFSERPVRDLIGLVTPASLPFAAESDMLGAFLVRPSELVVFHTFTPRGGTRPIVGRPWFARAYEEAARLALPEQGGEVVLYRRRPGTKVPPPRPPRPRPSDSRQD